MRRKSLAIKVIVVCLGGVICGLVVAVLFSLFFYGFLPSPLRAEVYLSDTRAKVKFRFWAAFILGTVLGMVWIYKAIRHTDFD